MQHELDKSKYRKISAGINRWMVCLYLRLPYRCRDRYPYKAPSQTLFPRAAANYSSAVYDLLRLRTHSRSVRLCRALQRHKKALQSVFLCLGGASIPGTSIYENIGRFPGAIPHAQRRGMQEIPEEYRYYRPAGAGGARCARHAYQRTPGAV